MTREVCKNCGRVSAVGFDVPDATWKAVVPERFAERVLCLTCFSMFGDEQMVPWDREIQFYPVSLRAALGKVKGEKA